MSDWLTETFRLAINNAGAIFTLAVLTIVPAALAVAGGLWAGVRDVTVTVESEPTRFSVEGGLNTPALLAGGLAYTVLAFLFTLLSTRVALSGRFGRAQSWSGALGDGARSFPSAAGWTLIGALAVVLAYFASVIIAGLAVASVGVVAFLAIPLLLVAALIVYGRYGMTFTAPLVGGRGNRSIAAVHRVTRGRTSAMIGRTVLLAIVSMTVVFSGSLLSSPIASLGGAQAAEFGATTIRFSDLIGDNLGVFAIGMMLNTLINAVASLVWHVGQGVLFEDLGGIIDPRLRAESDPAEEPSLQ